MLRSNSPRKLHLLLNSVLLSTVLVATALAVTVLIDPKDGSEIILTRGVKFVVPPKSLQRDAGISVVMELVADGLRLEFGPDGTTFGRKDQFAKLIISRNFMKKYDLENLTLYGEDGEISPEEHTDGLMWPIHHFSIYHFRRQS